jgi:hypothetical protein
MSGFFKDYLDDDLDFLEHDLDDSKRPNKAEYVGEVHLDKRFLNSNYMEQIRESSYTPEVVIKVIKGGMGKKATNYLMGYIARNLEKHKKEEALTIYDSLGNEIKTVEERTALTEELGGYFDSYKYTENAKLFNEEDEITYQDLLSKEAESDLTKAEEKQLNKLNERSYLLSKYHRLKDLEEKVKETGSLTKEEFIEKEEYEKDRRLKSKEFKVMKDVDDINHHNIKKDFTHMIFSHGGDKLNPKRAEKAMKDFLNEEFKDRGCDFVWSMHNDTKQLHFHVILFNKNRETGERVAFKKEDLYIMRQRFVHHSNKVGLKRVATLKQDRADRLNKFLTGVDNLKERRTQYQYKLAKGEERAFDAFDNKKKILNQIDRAIQTSAYLEDNKALLEKRSIKKAENVLKKLRKDLLNTSPEDIKKEIDTTVKSLSKEDTRLILTLKDIHYPNKKAKKLPEGVKKAKILAVDELREKHLERIEEATKIIRKQLSKTTDDKQKEKYSNHLDSLLSVRNRTMKVLEDKINKGGNIKK